MNLLKLLKSLIYMVPGAGIEPARYFYRGILSFSLGFNKLYLVDFTRTNSNEKHCSEPYGAHLGHKPAPCCKSYCRTNCRSKLLFIAVFGLVLAGCGSGDSDNRGRFKADTIEQSSSFIVSYDASFIDSPVLPRLEQWWNDVQECAGISYDLTKSPLTVNYVPLNWFKPGRIGQYEFKLTEFRYGGVATVLYADIDHGPITRHEMLHHLLTITGLWDYTNDPGGHNNIFFDDLCKSII